MHLDTSRLELIRYSIVMISRVAAIVAYMSQVLISTKTKLEDDDRLDIVKQLLVLLPDNEVTGEDVVFQVLHFAKKINSAQVDTSNCAKGQLVARYLNEEDLALLRGRIINLLTTGDSPVLKLLHKQLVNVIMHELDLDIVISNMFQEQTFVSLKNEKANDGDILDELKSFEGLMRKGGLYGLEDVLKEKVLQPMLIFCRHHEQVFHVWYNNIFEDLLNGKIRDDFLIDEAKL